MIKRILDWVAAHKVWSALIALCTLLVWPVVQQIYLDAVAPPVEQWLGRNAGPLVGPAMSFVVANAVALIGVVGLIVVSFFIGREFSTPANETTNQKGWTETRLRVRRDPSGSGSFLQVVCVNVDGWQQTFSKISHRDAEGKQLSEIQHDNIVITFEQQFRHSRPIIDVFGHRLPAYQYFPVGTRGALFMFTDAIDAPIMDIWFPPPDHYEKTGVTAGVESPANLPIVGADRSCLNPANS